jgi:hypothetical protein
MMTRAPSGPTDSSWGCPSATAKTCPDRYVDPLIVLYHREAASENEAADREMMLLLSLRRPWFESLDRYARITIGQKFRREFVLVHWTFSIS